MRSARGATRLTVTTTAMPRPEVLEKTFRSFRNYLNECDLEHSQLLINIDPFVDQKARLLRSDCMAVAGRYFGSVQSRLPDHPNFALALRWLWESTDESLILHLEDDWELVESVNLKTLIEQMNVTCCDHLMLRAWTWQSYPFCLGPGLLRRRLYKFCASVLTGAENPETTLRKALQAEKYSSIVHPRDRYAVVLRDIGRSWMRKAGYVRGGGSFVTWERETDINTTDHDRLADQNEELLKHSKPASG